MKSAVVAALTAAAASGHVLPGAKAADLIDPAVAAMPNPPLPEIIPASFSGWYLRGDIGHGWNGFDQARFDFHGPNPGPQSLTGDLGAAVSVGGGIGYTFNQFLRADVTLDHTFRTDLEGRTDGFCSAGGAVLACASADAAGYQAWTLLANGYADLGHYAGFTPYVGAGIGGAHVQWEDLQRTVAAGFDQSGTTSLGGASQWRLAYALMAGLSYAANRNVSIDLGYRYTHIDGGRMFDHGGMTGSGFDKGIDGHEVRAGLRYRFGAGARQRYR